MRALLLAALLGACSFEPGTFTTAAADARDGGDVDTDDDGVLDGTDNCVDIVNPEQRDWDEDKHGDACDGCPHLASMTDPDGDGDGVGDACDPRMNAAGDRRVHWLAFYAMADIADWITSAGGPWTVQAGKLVQPSPGFSLLDSPFLYGNLYFHARVELVNTSNEVGFCAANIPIGQQYYCCGAYLAGGNNARAASYWGQPVAIEQKSFPAGSPGQIVDFVGTLSTTQFQCAISKDGTTVNTMTSRGPAVLGSAVFYTTAAVMYHYAFVVTIGGT